MSTTTRKFKTIITDTGAKKLAQATAPDGKPVRLTHMAVGDGGGTLPTPDSKQTRLVHEVWRHTVNRVTLDATHQNHIIAELVIPPETGGFWIREIGVFDEHGDLIAVGNTAESYKPTVAEGSGRAQTFRTILTVSSTATVALTVDNTMVMATVNYVDDKLKEHEQSRRHPDASLTAKGLVQLSNATNSTSETLAATPKAVKAVMDETNKKAPLNSPALTGTPTTPTARQGTNNTQIASTAFVMAAIAALVDSSPDALNTLNELAAALGNDPNFATTMTNALAGKQPKDATLTALAGLATAADRFPYFTGNDVASLATLTKVGRDILAKSTVAAVIEYLGLQETVNRARNAVQKNGDTLSGGLTFENDSILAWIRNTDWAKIGFKNDADSDTDSYMWFETGDNGNEYFKWRHRIIGTRPKDLMNLKWNALSVL
ncbi:phage tail protein, partial [Escherichia coli]|uniref:phage tail protein n=1 Tax=Escherichia coli TaxID=562 RepID=UPI000A2E3B71